MVKEESNRFIVYILKGGMLYSYWIFCNAENALYFEERLSHIVPDNSTALKDVQFVSHPLHLSSSYSLNSFIVRCNPVKSDKMLVYVSKF